MKVAIRQIQTFYAEQMQAHGHGSKTFRFEIDAQGDPVVHRLDGQYPDSHYPDNTPATVDDEFKQVFDTEANNVYLVVIDNSIDAIGTGNGRRAGGVGGGGRNNGSALVELPRFGCCCRIPNLSIQSLYSGYKQPFFQPQILLDQFGNSIASVES